ADAHKKLELRGEPRGLLRRPSPLIHQGGGAEGRQPKDQTVLSAATGDGPREGAAAPRVLAGPESLRGQ
ncbi:hypothetical protein JZU48_02755, partial [bacterium]|nr:hypothetical protein [bacterium]